MRWPHQACSCQTYRPEVTLPAAVSRIGGIGPKMSLVGLAPIRWGTAGREGGLPGTGKRGV